eukprot:TRINITY_DN4520_c0_g1_i2.p1 TRINITY_DN4520_c0_g1~~TRINITY_DN4520_c0_g1_i2.p1  ORF type:complete len:611 (-),score=110.41 TRINITY_DN4520_c0_g1_i2:1352-3184(-)
MPPASVLVPCFILVLAATQIALVAAQSNSCSGLQTFSSTSGPVWSNNFPTTNTYGTLVTCTFRIQPSTSATYIALTFSRFNTTLNDELAIYSGTFSSSTALVSTLEGIVSPLPVVYVVSTSAFLSFSSLSSLPKGTGWSLTYSSSQYCATAVTMTSESGTLRSNTASFYTNSMSCAWTIQPVGANTITISFSSFSTERNYDFVYIYSGGVAPRTLLQSYSGSSVPSSTVVSSSTGAYVVFQTDSSSTYSGFVASYSSGFSYISVPQTVTGTPCGSRFSTVAGAQVGGTQGLIDSTYYNNMQCYWVINATSTYSGTTRYLLRFTSFDTESGFDYVTIYQGGIGGSVYSSYSGSGTSSTLTVTGSAVTIGFMADGSNVEGGWQLSWASCVGSSCQTLPSGTTSVRFNYAWLALIIPGGLCVLSLVANICRRANCSGCKGSCRRRNTWNPPVAVTKTNSVPPPPVIYSSAVVPPPTAAPPQPNKKVQPKAAGGVQPAPMAIDPSALYGAGGYGYAVPPPIPPAYGTPVPPPAWDPIIGGYHTGTAPPPPFPMGTATAAYGSAPPVPYPTDYPAGPPDPTMMAVYGQPVAPAYPDMPPAPSYPDAPPPSYDPHQ